MPTLSDRIRAIVFGDRSRLVEQASRPRLAGPPKSTQGRGVPTRETTAALFPKVLRGQTGGGGQLDRMERGHPRIGAGCERLALGVAARRPVLAGADDETPRERQFRELVQRIAIDEVFVDAHNGARGWGRLARPLSQYWTRGTSLFELRFTDAQGATYEGFGTLDGLGLEVYPIHVSSVTEWVTESTASDRLAGIVQGTSSRGGVPIPIADLVHLQHGGAVGEWEGVSILRPLVFLFERWASILMAAEKNSHLAGGLIVAAQPMSADAQDSDSVVASLNSLGLPYMMLPQGYATADIDIRYPSGTAPSPDATLTYIDAQIDQVFGDALQSLGFAAHGSRALGESMEDAGDWQSTAQLVELYDAYVSRACAWIAERVSYLGRMPRVTLGEDAADADADRVDVLGPAVSQGLITWTVDDEARLRESLGMQAREQVAESRTLLVGQIQAAQQIVASLTPADPLIPALAPAAALELLTAAGVPLESARSIIDATLDASGKPRLPAPAALSDCGCGSCGIVTLAEPMQTVIGADGMPFESPVALVGVETQVEWASIDRSRAALDAAFDAEIERLANTHRADTWAALRDGWQPGEREEVRQRARDRYFAAIERYANATRGVVTEHAAREMERQARGSLPTVEGEAQALPPLPDTERVRASIAAEEMASRVQSEVEQAWAAGVPRQSFASRITVAGLTRSGKAVGNAIESTGRLEAARDLAARNPGLVIKAVVRSSVLDRNRCQVCEDRHGTQYELPRQMAEFEAMPLPDPQCLGTDKRCRCGWLIEWGRQ